MPLPSEPLAPPMGQHIDEPFTELLLVRHGRSYGNAKHHIIQGSSPDPANTIDSMGEEQARCTAGVMLGEGLHIVGAWSSHLERASKTGEICLGILGSDLSLTKIEGLGEMCKGLDGLPGGMEGRLRVEVETDEFKAAAKTGGWDFRYGSRESGGETPREVGERTLAALLAIALAPTQDNHETRPGFRPVRAVFSHGQAIRYAVGVALGLSFEVVNRDLMLGNGCGILVKHYSRTNQWELSGRLNINAASA